MDEPITLRREDSGTQLVKRTFRGPFVSPHEASAFLTVWADDFLVDQCEFLDVYDPTMRCEFDSKECPEAIRFRAGRGVVRRTYVRSIHKWSCAFRILPIGGDSPPIQVHFENCIIECEHEDEFLRAFAFDVEGTIEIFDYKRPIFTADHCTVLIHQPRRNFEFDRGYVRDVPGRPKPRVANSLLTFAGGRAQSKNSPYCQRYDAYSCVVLPTFKHHACPGITRARWTVDANYRPLDTPVNREFVIGKADPRFTPETDFYGNPRDMSAPTVGAVEYVG